MPINFYLKDSIAWIPMPFRFLKGAFESGIARRLLECYAESPSAFLDERGKSKLGDVARALWRRFSEGIEEGSGSHYERSGNDCGDEDDTLTPAIV